jgi:transcription-repair coupling factor (superfamily II helicase)
MGKLDTLFQPLLEGRSLLIEELWNSPKAYIAMRASRELKKNVLILTGQSQEEARLFHDFAYFGPTPVIDYPAWETLPSENIAPSPDIVGERYEALRRLSEEQEPHIILSSLQACLQKLIVPERFQELSLMLKVGDTVSFSPFQEKLLEMGFKKAGVASDKGEFAVRGGIIDLYPVSSPDPFRIEFFGDEIASIRTYDPIGQRSVAPVDRISLLPALELEMLDPKRDMASLIDYLGPDTLVMLDDLLALEDRWATLKGQHESPAFLSLNELFDRLEGMQKIFMTATLIEQLSGVKRAKEGIEFEAFGRSFVADRGVSPFLSVCDFLFLEEGEDIVEALSGKDIELRLLVASDAEEKSFLQKMRDRNLILPHHTQFERGYLSSGYGLSETKQLILPMAELTHRFKIRRQKLRSTFHSSPSEPFSLIPGECVVHFHQGIGKYLGLEKRGDTEYLQIEYAEGAKLFVPVTQAHLISKYIGSSEELPRLHTLGASRWRNQKEKTERAILNYASDLLKVYAQRELKGGFSFRSDSSEVASFEDEFPFVETEDQLRAVEEIKADMVSKQAMDRLICGDVGYGKTEVAMRAAFKAVLDGEKQVAMLVPTTVLAMQHYENFVERMANFPINVAVMSRFRSSKEIRETLKGLESGSVDIVIGTHRIISEDVKFRDLGLIIIDEEQRFGVKAKEHLKKIKTGVDCLTLSATPIPRTLYLSLMGARDMSVIHTPPQDRLPIKTVLTEPSDTLMKTALLREIARGGQAFVIHNRVETIYGLAQRVKEMLPQAKVAVAHGQMSTHELDDVFHAFKEGRADILVATTIVENGVDIPNANTILIDRADHFGLADLYQLRGRVGRWNRRAYAYFLIKNMRMLPELTRKRLQALAESSGYGGGMRLAMRDLEIRGAGDILGYEQSGHVATIGFHLYCKLLKRAVQSLQGKVPAALTDTKLEIPVDARLPEDYVNDVSLRMELYQRLGEALSEEEVDALFKEIIDRFGAPPLPALWLCSFSKVRAFAALEGFTGVKIEGATLIAEKKKEGKLERRHWVFSLPSDPKTFEMRLIALLKNEF